MISDSNSLSSEALPKGSVKFVARVFPQLKPGALKHLGYRADTRDNRDMKMFTLEYWQVGTLAGSRKSPVWSVKGRPSRISRRTSEMPIS